MFNSHFRKVLFVCLFVLGDGWCHTIILGMTPPWCFLRRNPKHWHKTEACLFVCLIVCLYKPRTVTPQRLFHSWRLSFTQDGLAFSTKTAQRALQGQLRYALSTSWRTGSAFKVSNPCWPHWIMQARRKTHPNPPNKTPWRHIAPDTQASEVFELNRANLRILWVSKFINEEWKTVGASNTHSER